MFIAKSKPGRILAGMAALCVLGAAGMRAWSQDDAFRLLSGAIVGPKMAYIPLHAEMVTSARVEDISPNNEGQDAIMITTLPPPLRGITDLLQPDGPANIDKRMMQQMENGGHTEVNVLLWSADSRKASTIWRGGGSLQTGLTIPASVQWFPNSRIALLQVLTFKGPVTPEQMRDGLGATPTISLVRINGATGKTQALTTTVNLDAPLLFSPTNPTVAIVSSEGSRVQFIGPSGDVSLPQPVKMAERKPGDHVRWHGWLTDGKTLHGTYTAVPSEGKGRSKRVFLDTVTGVVSDDPMPKGTEPAYGPLLKAMPFVVHKGHGTLVREGAKTNVYPLWLEGSDKETVGRTLIAPDSDPNKTPTVLQTAVLYQHQGAVYAVPILKSNAPEFLAQRREAQKQETMKRAKQIGLAMMMYGQDYDDTLPPVGSALSDIVNPYLKNADAFNNPATGQSGFTPLYKSSSLVSYETPATTPLGYLTGPGGTAVIYIDGHVKWEDRPGGT